MASGGVPTIKSVVWVVLNGWNYGRLPPEAKERYRISYSAFLIHTTATRRPLCAPSGNVTAFLVLASGFGDVLKQQVLSHRLDDDIYLQSAIHLTHLQALRRRSRSQESALAVY